MKTYHKVLLAGAVGYGLYRWGRHAEQKNLGLTLPFTQESAILTAARSQVLKAMSGTALSDYRSAEDVNLFWKAPVGGQEANAKCAYWLAVASRILNNKTLAAQAYKFSVKAFFYAQTPGSSLIEGEAAPVLKEAVEILKPYAGNKQITAILAALGHQVIEGTVIQDQAKKEQAVAVNTAAASAEDAASLVQYGRGIITGEKPPGSNSTYFAVVKWGGRLVLGAGVLLLLRYALKPYLEGAKSVWGKAKAGAAELGNLVQNGRKLIRRVTESA